MAIFVIFENFFSLQFFLMKKIIAKNSKKKIFNFSKRDKKSIIFIYKKS